MYIMNIYLFFTIGTCILFCRGLIKCLDPQRPHVCGRYVITSKQFKFACCPNYYEYEDACKECQAGTYGDNCSEICLPNYYGAACINMCNCNRYSKCDHVKGCICNDGFTGTDCKDSCLVGRFGRNCSETCTCPHDVTCDPQTGQCKGKLHDLDPICTQNGPNLAIIGLSVVSVVMLTSTIILSILLNRRRIHQILPPNTVDNNVVHYHEIQPYGEFSLEGLTQEIHPPHQRYENIHSRQLLHTNNQQTGTSGLQNVVNEDGGYLNPYCVVQPYSNTDRVYKRLFPPLTRSLSTGYMTPSSTETNTLMT